MKSREEIEAMFIELELPFERLGDDIWVVMDEHDHLENLVVYQTGSVLNLRVKLFELGGTEPPGLFRHLLELNASDVVHGAYAIENDSVVLTGALEVDNLDLNELQAVFESFGIALSTHHPKVVAFLKPDAASPQAQD